MSAHDLCPIQVEYLSNSIDLIEKTERSDTANLQFSIANLQSHLVRVRSLR
jgi:hypothetical protein